MEKFTKKQQNISFWRIPEPQTFTYYPKSTRTNFPHQGRPIVSANQCPSERISQFVDHFIQPIVTTLPSYLRDSSHLINIVKDLTLPSNAILASLDVVSLYTNIPNDEGIHATGIFLQRHRPPQLNPTNSSIRQLLKLVLTTNNFRFDNKDFLQIGGTAMGTKLAPSFANLFMGYLDEKFVYTYHLKPFIWKRFIDDIFFVWTYGQSELDTFVKYLNNCHDSIKFTLESSTEHVHFLDINITTNTNGCITTSLYCKPTDSHNYLLFSSEHPRHILNGIPYSQFICVKRLCSKQEDFLSNCYMLCTHFIRRGYPKHLVRSSLQRADKLTREELLNKQLLQTPITPALTTQTQTKIDTFYCITTHNPLNPPIKDVVLKNWEILGKSKTTRTILDAKIIFGQCRNKNLSDQLVRASASEKPSDDRINNSCKRPTTCRYCCLLNKSGKIRSTTTGKVYRSMINITCQSQNIIYLITCTHCKIQYVGQTKKRLLTRFQGHYHDIQHDNDTTVGRHFNRCPRDNPSKFEGLQISVLQFIRSPPDSRNGKTERDKEEKRWINRLSSIVPRGLNLLD